MGGVVMHNLRRVAAGLRGEYLEPEATPEPEELEPDFGTTSLKGDGKRGKQGGLGANEQSEWQDMSEFEREEGQIEVGDLGATTNVLAEGGEVPQVEVVTGAEQGGAKRTQDVEDAGMDKEARKKAKKARNMERLRKKEEERAGKLK